MVVVESVVKKALIKFYEEKYKDLEEKEQKKSARAHLKNVFPEKESDISNSEMSTRGYMDESKDFTPVAGNDVEKIIDNSGYRIVYDSFTEGLEPIYFWILDYMRDTYWGIGLEVSKTMDKFEASAGGGFFGDMGTRASIMQDRAMKMMGTINTVTRSIINLLYDLKEFDQRLQLYKDLKDGSDDEKKNARLALKQFWMDKVDIQRGRGSINMLSQQLQFVTLRDAFMAAENAELKTPEGKVMDLNERVKRILGPRVADYLTWEKLSGKELERRYKIEKNYLRSQVESLKLYAQWTKPYLQAAKGLHSELTSSPDLVTTFNTMQVQTTLFGTKKDGDFFVGIEVGFDFRTVPHTMKQTQTGVHYTQGGRVDMQFRGFALNEEEKKAVEEYETHEALEMANINKEMIEEVEESLKDYLEGEDDKEFEDPRERLGFLQTLVEKESSKDVRKDLIKDIEKIKKELKVKNKGPGPFEALLDNFKEVPKFFKKSKKTGGKSSRSGALGTAAFSAYLIYNVYKKAHGMYTE